MAWHGGGMGDEEPSIDDVPPLQLGSAVLFGDLPGMSDAAEAGDAARRQENLQRRLADQKLCDALAADGFRGARYRRFEEELAAYGISVLRGWMSSGSIFKAVAERGFNLSPTDYELEELVCNSDVREELATMTVAVTLPKFRERALVEGGWTADGGASLPTYFVGATLYVFPNEFRKYRAYRLGHARATRQAAVTLEPVGDVRNDPSVIVPGAMHVLEVIRALDGRAAPVVALRLLGYSQEEIAEILGLRSVRAVEGSCTAADTRSRTSTSSRWRNEVIPVTDRDDEFEALMEKSSLGSPGARRLRRRTSRTQAQVVRRIAELRAQMAHGNEQQRRQAEIDMIGLFRELGYRTQIAATGATSTPRSEESPATVEGRADSEREPGRTTGAQPPAATVPSSRDDETSRIPIALKIVVAGGFGAGKTTMIASVSEIRPLQTEEILTGVEGADNVGGMRGKTTTVTMDFGRITLSEDLLLYLFGTPGQDRFWFLWDELSQGALGAVVLANTRRLADCFPSIDYFEQRGTPFVVAVNCFEAEPRFAADVVGRALDLDPGVPVLLFDAREPLGARNVLIELVEYVARRQRKYSAAGSR